MRASATDLHEILARLVRLLVILPLLGVIVYLAG
jgi:hypothetical protein